MRIQFWSYNYDPEPMGIAPLSAALARELTSRGHEVEVIAAHPHYPEPRWGTKVLPYVEERDGVRVVRFPIWPGRTTRFARIRQELSHLVPLTLAAPFLRRADIAVVVSPSFPGIAAARIHARARRMPWILWLQDILPDGATVAGVLKEGRLIETARAFERSSYRSAAAAVVISDSFVENLTAKGVPESKVIRIYNPASMPVRPQPRDPALIDPQLVLNMGNIGHTQNLVAVTEAFEANDRLKELGARFVMAGDGVAGPDVRASIRSDRVEVTGVVKGDRLSHLLERAAIGLVSQSYEGVEFNVPSKLMNFMGQGIPVVAAVRPQSEVARIVTVAHCGWVAPSAECAAEAIAVALRNPAELKARAAAGLEFARENFDIGRVADGFEQALESAVGAGN